MTEWYNHPKLSRPDICKLAKKAADDSVSYEERLVALWEITRNNPMVEENRAAAQYVAGMLDTGTDLSCWAAIILAKSGRPIHAHDAFLDAARSDDPNLVKEAMYSMHSFSNRPAEEVQKVKAAVLPCLKHPDQWVRGFCCMFVTLELTDEDLKTIDLQESDPINGVVGVLSKMEKPPTSAIDLLIKGLFDDDPDTRNTSAPNSLIRLGEVAKQPVIAVALDMDNPVKARCAALRTIRLMDSIPEEAVSQLSNVVNEAGEVAYYAAAALARQGVSEVEVIEKLVIGHACDKEYELGAAGCIGLLPREKTVPVLIAQMKVADDFGKRQLASLLSEIGFDSPGVAEVLIDELSRAEDLNLEQALISALGELSESADESMIAALESAANAKQMIRLLNAVINAVTNSVVVRSALPAKLQPYVDHDDPRIAALAAIAISSIDRSNVAVIPHLQAAMTTAPYPYHFRAMGCVAKLGELAAPCVSRLIEYLNSSDRQNHIHAARALGHIGTAAAPAIPRLAQLMSVESSSSEAIHALGAMHHPDAVPYLVQGLDNQKIFKDVVKAFGKLSEFAGPAVKKLQTMLNGPHRFEAVQALGELGEVASIAASDVIPLLSDSDPEVRLATIETLGNLKVAGTELYELAEHGEPEMRLAAMKALGGPRPREAISALLAAANSDDEELVKAAFIGLSGYGDKTPDEFVPLLLRRFDNGNEEIQWAVIYALKRLGPSARQAVHKLIPLLTDTVNGFSETVFSVIKEIGPDAVEALSELERLLNHRRFRHEARSAIWKIAPGRAKELHLNPIG